MPFLPSPSRPPWRWIVGGLALAGAACAPNVPREEPIERALPDTAALARDIPELLRSSGVPGLSIAVVRGGRTGWSRAFGTVNDPDRAPLERTTVFEAASLSKPVFAWLVLRLAGRGDIDLDRPLAELVDYPRLSHDPRWRRITARTVLSHATGMPNWGGDTLRLAFDPGTGYGYSGEAFAFLQGALERATGRSLEALARREVFEPLGMTHSGFVWQDRFEGHAAWATSWLGHVAPVSRWAEPNAAYTLITTADDYARFVGAVLTGEGLSRDMWRAFLSPVRETSPGIYIGLGIRLEDGPAGRRFYHSGSNGRRFTCYMAGDLGTGTGLVFFTGVSDGTSLVRALASRAFGEDSPPRHWEGFGRHDDPRRLALASVRGAALDGGAAAARERLRELQAGRSARLGFDDLLELGEFLSGRGLHALSIEVLGGVAAESPDSTAAHLALGRALESAGDIEAGLASYRRAAALDPADREARDHIRWAEERLAARARAPVVAEAVLGTYAGEYGERSVRLRDGRLHYGGGAEAESALVPMGETLFELERDPGTRLRFEGDELVATYRDGSVDRFRRRHSTRRASRM
jgi:CubicO group peptidase (beta-lactamase class C family)